MSPRASAGPAEAVAIPEWAIQVSHWRDEALDSVRFGSSKVCTGIDTVVKDAAAQATAAAEAKEKAGQGEAQKKAAFEAKKAALTEELGMKDGKPPCYFHHKGGGCRFSAGVCKAGYH